MAATPASSGQEYAQHCLELLQPLGTCNARRMFGGRGIYLDGLMFALIAFERLYLKVDSTTEPRWQAAGGQPFLYDGKGRTVKMNYYTPPDEALESPQLMQPWACLALEAALRARAEKAARPAAKKTIRSKRGAPAPRTAAKR